jgi:hypothetical protein
MINNVMLCRHLTTTRPLPPRPDIVSSQTGPFDSVNSFRHISLAPIEKPNIPSSIDTITLKEKYNSSEIAHECYEEHLYIQSGIDNCDKPNY